MRMQRPQYVEAAERDYPNVRAALSETYRRLPAEQLGELVQQRFGPAFAVEDAEGFFQTLAKVGQIAAPIVLPAIGTVIGGPAGTAIGAIGGSLVSNALGGVADGPQGGATPPRAPRQRPGAAPRRPAPARRQAPRPGTAAGTPRTGGIRPHVRPQGSPPVPAPAPAAAASAEPGTGLQSSAAQLAGILGRPEFLLALASAMFGDAGRPTVPVGDDDVPVGALLNLPNVLGEAARVENHLLRGGGPEAVPSYLFSESGEALCEVTDDRERAEVLLGMLAEVAFAEARSCDRRCMRATRATKVMKRRRRTEISSMPGSSRWSGSRERGGR